MKKKTNKCLKCKWWKKEVCIYDPCQECEEEQGLIPYWKSKDPNVKTCDGTCNPPECKYGYDECPEEWNPKYKYYQANK